MTSMEVTLITNAILSCTTFLFTSSILGMFIKKRDTIFTRLSNRLLCSMLLCDQLKSIMLIFHSAIEWFSETLSRPGCHSCLVFAIMVDVMTSFLTKVFVLHLCAMVYERYVAVTRALKFNQIFTSKFVKRLLVSVWIIPALASIIQLVYLYPYLLWKPEKASTFEWIAIFDIVYALLAFMGFTLIPSLAISISFVLILNEIRSIERKGKTNKFVSRSSPVLKRSIHNTFGNGSYTMKRYQRKVATAFVMRSRHRAAICLFVIFVSFVILSFPYFLLRLYVDLMMWQENEVTLSPVVFDVVYTMKNVTLLLNALIYILMNREVRDKTVAFLF